MYQMTRRCFQALEAWSDPFDDLNVSSDYSGRFMHGRRCFALTAPNPVQAAMLLTRFILEALDDPDTDPDELLEALQRGVNQDQMGLDSVVYWPNVTVQPA